MSKGIEQSKGDNKPRSNLKNPISRLLEFQFIRSAPLRLLAQVILIGLAIYTTMGIPLPLVSSPVAFVLVVWYSHRVLLLQEVNKRTYWIIILIVALIFGLVAYHSIKKELSNSKDSPELPTFTEGLDQMSMEYGNEQLIHFAVGGGLTAGYTMESILKKNPVLIVVDGYNAFPLYVEDGILFLDAKIFTGRNIPPIEFKRNTVIGRPVRWQTNFNENALEIVDEEIRPRFQLIKDGSNITVYGLFWLPNDKTLVAMPGSAPLSFPEMPQSFTLKPIFKYPRSLYKGILAEAIQPSTSPITVNIFPNMQEARGNFETVTDKLFSEGSYNTWIVFSVYSQFPLTNVLRIGIRSRTIKNAIICKKGTWFYSNRTVFTDSLVYLDFINAFGEYDIRVECKEPYEVKPFAYYVDD